MHPPTWENTFESLSEKQVHIYSTQHLIPQIYKASLKRNSELFKIDWIAAHEMALQSVTRDICIKIFRRCEVPESETTLTTEEQKEDRDTIAIAVAALIAVRSRQNKFVSLV